jgi:hypothetical protein
MNGYRARRCPSRREQTFGQLPICSRRADTQSKKRAGDAGQRAGAREDVAEVVMVMDSAEMTTMMSSQTQLAGWSEERIQIRTLTVVKS